MKSPISILPDLKELGGLILGFLPWLLFLFLSGKTLSSLERAIVWASLMSLSVALSILRRTSLLNWPGWVYFGLSLVIIISGLTYTTVFKRQKRLKRLSEENGSSKQR